MRYVMGWLASRRTLVGIGCGLAIALMLASALVLLLHRTYDPYGDPCADVASGEYETRCGFSGVLGIATLLVALAPIPILILLLPDDRRRSVDAPK